ncbi:hypothetical protein AMAG_09141 [Allomyces macrogynus ATCC 38327]|uniref:NrS-1 polymerase-like helicase domain-containing protein n=1 Tax=Allomyces macrogynus (strain ATCC 38327) TaxID=578462 RepID=A0A0L0SNJ8_ALLM3|nr:hypothetical protein AMAG_09141 [Allomyces macrogynus ATCC 38327]|eukprot:KNE64083.1 hypothetical protein AMAG_09141 [Allomyces macrogynus ATCC 38327]
MNAAKIAATLANIETQFDDGRRIVLNEFISVERAAELLERYSGLDREEKRKFKSQYMARYSKEKGKETVYEHKTPLRNLEKKFGRLYPTSESLQRMNKEVFRNPLTHGVLQDLDMVGAAPSILRGILAHYNKHSDALDLYVSDRAAALARYKVDKQKFLAVLFDEFPTYAMHPEVTEMHRVLYEEVAPRVEREFPDIVKFCKTRAGGAVNKGSLLSNLFNAVESVILVRAVDYCRANDVVPSVLMFDGLMVKRDVERVNDQFLAGLHAYTTEQTGFDVAWAEKPIPAGAQAKSAIPAFCEDPQKFAAEQIEKCDGAYKDRLAMKFFEHMSTRKSEEDQESWMAALVAYLGEFVRKDLKTGEHYFRRTVNDPWELNVSEKIVDAVFSRPLHKLFPQVKQRTFDLYAPKWGPSADNGLIIEYFNAFSGFAAKKLDRKVEESEIKLYLDYLRTVVCAGRDAEFQYVLRWIQWILTTGKPSGVMLMMHGLEGAGKGMFFSLLAEFILGRHNCTTINDLGKFLKGDFNSELENKILVLVDEIAAVSQAKRNEIMDVMKNVMTDDYRIINEKYVKKYQVANTNNFVGATNNSNPLNITETCRRILALLVSNLYRNNKQYFNVLKGFVKANADAIFTYIVDLDLEHIDISHYPRNEERQEMVEASLDPVGALVKDFIEYGGFARGINGRGAVTVEQEMDIQDLYEIYRDYRERRFPGNHTLSMVGFGRELGRHVVPHEETKKLFEKVRKRIDGRMCQVYIYKGPSVVFDDE